MNNITRSLEEVQNTAIDSITSSLNHQLFHHNIAEKLVIKLGLMKKMVPKEKNKNINRQMKTQLHLNYN